MFTLENNQTTQNNNDQNKELLKIKREYFKLIQLLAENADFISLPMLTPYSNFMNPIFNKCDDNYIREALNFHPNKVIIDNGLCFELNNDEMTAELSKSPSAQGKIMIPKSITFNLNEYIVKKVDLTHIDQSKVTSIDFPEDSEVETIENKEYNIKLRVCKINKISSAIEYIKIPPNLKYLKEGWCFGFSKSINIEISSKNKCFKLIDDKLLVGKSDENKENFDLLLFSRLDSEEINVPSYIERIEAYCFYNCTRLKRVLFENDSKLQSIGNFSFSNSTIEQIMIPKHVTIIGRHSFEFCKNLNTIEFDNDSELNIIDNHAFYGTSIEKIVIPSHVKAIEGCAFCECKKLTVVEFAPNSELQYIGKFSFESTSIEKITIPQHVKIIDNNSFDGCVNLKSCQFEPNSELQIIGSSVFKCSFDHITIPPHVKRIGSFAFRYCKELKKVEVLTELNMIDIGKDAFPNGVLESK